MNSKRGRNPARRIETWIGMRIGLSLLVATALTVGAGALLAPRSFYDDFPAVGRGWVSSLPPFNEHLVRDVGALNLALAVLLAYAAVVLERRLVRVSLLAWLVYATPHFVYHLTETGTLPLFDDAANVGGLYSWFCSRWPCCSSCHETPRRHPGGERTERSPDGTTQRRPRGPAPGVSIRTRAVARERLVLWHTSVGR